MSTPDSVISFLTKKPIICIVNTTPTLQYRIPDTNNNIDHPTEPMISTTQYKIKLGTIPARSLE